MNNWPGRSRGARPRRRRRRPARAAVAITVMTTAGLLAACSSSPASARSGHSASAANTGASAITASAVRYAACIRSHGVPEYPDPNSAGQLPKITPANEAQLGVSDSRFQQAQAACQPLWPYQGPTEAQQQQELTYALTFARCMRSHGVPNWPDPTTESGHVQFVISGSSGIDLSSTQLLAKARGCEHGLPTWALPPSPDGVEVTTSP